MTTTSVLDSFQSLECPGGATTTTTSALEADVDEVLPRDRPKDVHVLEPRLQEYACLSMWLGFPVQQVPHSRRCHARVTVGHAQQDIVQDIE
eukprot:5787810-Pyramimonas_sp.AAC.1